MCLCLSVRPQAIKTIHILSMGVALVTKCVVDSSQNAVLAIDFTVKGV